MPFKPKKGEDILDKRKNLMLRLKADLHIHTSDDRHDPILHSKYELIDAAAKQRFDVLAITNHDIVTFDNDLKNYALAKGITLIPGIEKTIKRKHVLLLNAFPATEKISTFEELARAKEDGVFVIAPHPFHPGVNCLRKKIHEHLELFDALEFCYYYTRWFDPNKKTLRLSTEAKLPVVGSSDCHLLPYLGVCHSYIEVENTTIDSILNAIRKHRVGVSAEPQSAATLARIMTRMTWNKFGKPFTPEEKPKSIKTRTPATEMMA